MLQEIHLCTPPIAQAVTRTYPTVQALHHAYQGLADREERISMLADVEVRTQKHHLSHIFLTHII